MEHVTIISKEVITKMMPEITNVIGYMALLLILFVFGCAIYDHRKIETVEEEKTLVKVVLFASGIVITLILVIGIVGNIFFRVPTGRYKYEATIDAENMTVAEYREFMHAYNHTKSKNGVYYFEDWIE